MWKRVRGVAARVAGAAGHLLPALALCVATPAAAVRIGFYKLTGAETVESFEGLSPGPDVGVQLGFSGVYLPGNGGNYTFASGVTLMASSVDVFPGGVFVQDFSAYAPPPNKWGATGTVDGPEDVPYGDAYLAVFQAGTAQASIDLRFATPQLRVGAFVTGMAGSTITIDVYGAGGTLLESETSPALPLKWWGLDFLGVERPEGITRVVFRGHDFGIDNLTFQALSPIPEPGTALLVAVGLAGLARRPRRGQRARATR